MAISRRSAAGLVAGTWFAGSESARAAGSLRPEQVLSLVAAVHGGTDGRPVFAALEGWASAVAPGGAIEPIAYYRGVRASCRLPRRDGWLVQWAEVGLHSGEVPGAGFYNPITGRVVTAPRPEFTRGTHEMTASSIPQWTISRDEHALWLDRPFTSVALADQDVPPGGLREAYSFVVRVLDVAAERAVSSRGAFLRTTTWPEWLDMQDTPGHLFYQLRHVSGRSSPENLTSMTVQALDAADSEWRARLLAAVDDGIRTGA